MSEVAYCSHAHPSKLTHAFSYRPFLPLGLIPPDGIFSFSQPATHRSIKENKKASSFDSLDKALVVFKHPANNTTRPRDIYRRVDLIVCRWPSFGAAVVGWSGSTQFERDLRKHAEKMCVVLSSFSSSLRRFLLDGPLRSLPSPPSRLVLPPPPLLSSASHEEPSLTVAVLRRGLKFDSGGLRVRGTNEVIPYVPLLSFVRRLT